MCPALEMRHMLVKLNWVKNVYEKYLESCFLLRVFFLDQAKHMQPVGNIVGGKV
jgi:hypothetical protein